MEEYKPKKAITRHQAVRRVKKLLRNLDVSVMQTVEKLLDSGAIELKDHPDNFELPKILITAALKRESDKWQPFHPEGRDKVRELMEV